MTSINLHADDLPLNVGYSKGRTHRSANYIEQTKGERVKAFLKQNAMVIMIVVGAVLGTVIGIAINKPIQNLEQPHRYTAITLIGFPGEILLRALKMLILPLITFSLIVGLTSLDNQVSGRIGIRAVTYYMSTTVLAAMLGLALVVLIQPGVGMRQPDRPANNEVVRPMDSFMDIMRNMVPSNIVKAAIQQDKTKIVLKKDSERKYNKTFDLSHLSSNETKSLYQRYEITSFKDPKSGNITYYTTVKTSNEYKIGAGLYHPQKANFLGLIVFAVCVGKIAGAMGDKAKPFVDFITVFNDIITQLVLYVMWYSPFGIMSLIMSQFAEMENIMETFASLGLFIVTVLLGIGVHGLIVLPLIYFVITRQNPYKYLQGLTEALLTAFGTDSSAATLPVTFKCLEENLKLDKRITRFILPVGATINMDGTALYEAVSAIFIAQAVGASLSFGDYVAISFTSILASVGAAAIPHAGLVTMLIVLETVGLPADLVPIIFTVDWFLDRVRTMINVYGDAVGTGIVQHLSKADLEKQPERNDDEMTTF